MRRIAYVFWSAQGRAIYRRTIFSPARLDSAAVRLISSGLRISRSLRTSEWSVARDRAAAVTAALNEAVRAVADPSSFVVGRSATDIKRLLDGSVDQALGTAIRGFFEPDVPAAEVEAAALLYADAHAIAARYKGQLPESDEDGEVEEARLRALGRSEQHIQSIVRIFSMQPTGQLFSDGIVRGLLATFGLEALAQTVDFDRSVIHAGWSEGQMRAALFRHPSIAGSADRVQALLTRSAAQITNTSAGTDMEGEASPTTSSPHLDSPSLSSVIPEIAQALIDAGKWSRETAKDAERLLNQLVWIIGDKPTGAYRQRDLARFVKALWRIPKTFRVQSIWERPWSAVEPSLPAATAANKRSAKTLNKDLAYLSTAFEQLKNLGYSVDKEVKPLGLGASVSAVAKRGGRVPWKVPHLSTMLSSPIWTGNAGSKRRLKSGDQVFHDAGYWMLPLAIYVLARQNEIAGLTPADFVFDHPIPHIIIQENSLRGLKTESSYRWVPIHPRLLALGLEAYVKAIAAEGHAAVFPELWLNAAKVGGDQYRSAVWNKLITWMGHQPGFVIPRTAAGKAADFHSIRATGLSQLDRKSINQNIVKDIAGHAREGVTAQNYQKLLESGGLTDVLAERLAVLKELPDVAAHLQTRPLRLLALNLRSR